MLHTAPKITPFIMLASILFCTMVFGGDEKPGRYYSEEHGVFARKIYKVKSIIFDDQDRKLYVFGHIETSLERDSWMPPEEPKILQYSENGNFEREIYGAFFGLEGSATLEHKYDAEAKQTWFVDPIKQRILKYAGNPESASPVFFKKIQRGPEVEAFLNAKSMRYYGFSVSITKKPVPMWVAKGSPGRLAVWARDETNGLLWERERGVLKIHSDNHANVIEVYPKDIISKIIPNNRNATAWVHLSHKHGIMENYDRKGNLLGTIPLGKFRGPNIPITIDFPRNTLWFIDRVYPCKLIKMTLAGKKQLELSSQEITGEKYGCGRKITLQKSDGGIWIYFRRLGIFKLDSSGKVVQKIKLDSLKLSQSE